MSEFLAAHFDYLTFVFASLCVLGGVALYLHRRGSPLPGVYMFPIAGILIGGTALVRHAETLEKERLKSLLYGYAQTYARETEHLGHASLSSTPSPDDPVYLALIQAQRRWQASNNVVADIYTMRRGPDGVITFVVDSETDYDGDGKYTGEREGRTTPGEPYEEPGESFMASFDGTPGFTDVYTDRWGDWVSATTPLYDPAGRIEGVLGVDYPAEDWQAAVGRARLGAIGFVGVVLVILIGAASTTAILRARVIESRSFAAEQAESRRELLMLNQQLEELSLTDGLTGVRNRRAFDHALTGEMAKADRNRSALSLLLIDIDHFKSFNDQFGHLAGDEALKAVAAVLQRNARLYDFVARYGGEEFAVILYGAHPPEAIIAAERLRSAVETAPWPHRPVTISIGAATAKPEMSMQALIESTDDALYRAKEAGRNRVVHSDEAAGGP